MGMPVEGAASLGVFLAGLHDLGKFAEAFQQLRPDLRQGFWPNEKIRKRRYSIRHDSLGWMLWSQYLKDKAFPDADAAFRDFLDDGMKYWLAAVFGHHGWPPERGDRMRHHFRDFDQQAALAFLQSWRQLVGLDIAALNEAARDEAFSRRQKEASWLLAGIAVLVDWLGSNREFFPFCDRPMPLQDYWEQHALPGARRALEASGLDPARPAAARPPETLFDYIDEPTPLQRLCLELPLADGPQLILLEDLTGAGKTEAAALLAHRLMAAGLAEGLYIGLPTMATANAMYERMAAVYRRFYAHDAKPSLILSHGARHLSNDFRQSLLDAEASDAPYGGEESIGAQCNRWLADNRKKALLAEVGVGTIDQALLAVLPARHQSLRLLGLLGKVLILDEVHAYDAYTAEHLKNLVAFHAALGGSVILLSATLTRHQRQEFVKAFSGRGELETSSQAYPLLTQVSASGELAEHPVATRPAVARSVRVDFIHDEAQALQHIRGAVEQGQCICWIRNTISDAREAWQMLANADWLSADRLHLFHSRYAMRDRLAIEGRMLALFGKRSGSEQRRGRVLVATQVVEQSLDLDFDRMISDLAPIDLLIQRAGRLQRHRRDASGNPLSAPDAREQRGPARLTVHAPPFEDEPAADWYEARFPKARFVYGDTLILWRGMKILRDKQGWRMPEDARALLEFVYDPEGVIPPGLADAHCDAEGEQLSQRDIARFGALKIEGGYWRNEAWDEEARVATRLGDESQVVYLARWRNGRLTPWADEGAYRWDLNSLRLRAGQLKSVEVEHDPALIEALNQLREQEKRFDEHSLIIPLQPGEGLWLARGLDDKGRQVEIRYDPESGLELRRRDE
jgi:CRISPR-associated endonuclease/helicase Cas3